MSEKIKNPYEGLRIEFHILQSFPVSCLNRDDVGSPKTAMVGGVLRARVSSQCWKRAVRMAMKELGANLGFRTKYVGMLLGNELIELGADSQKAKELAQKIELVLNGKSSKKKGKSNSADSEEKESSGKTDTLLFLSPLEIKKIANKIREDGFSTKNMEETKDIEKIIGDKINKNIDAIDIALFGRMVANVNKFDVQASSSFSHAISTHKISNEVDFFTAVDDMQPNDAQGSAHMGSLEFNSATYYRYINLDLGQLYKTLSDNIDMIEAVDKFIKALFLAVPSARQNSMAGYSPWEYAIIYIRKGQPLQVPFETPVKYENGGGYIEPSKKELKRYLETKEEQYSSLFNKLLKIEFGEEPKTNIDKIISEITNKLKEVTK